MNKIYLIYGEEKYNIDKYIDKLKSEYSNYDLVNYDMFENNISEALEDALMGSLFSSNKLIICNNCTFLTGLKCEIDHNTDYLLKYMKNDTDNILILSVITDKLDSRKKVVKELEKYNIVKFEKLKKYELNKFIKDYCTSNGFKINDSSVNLFIDKLCDDLYILTSELNKLFIYKDNKTIDEKDIELCTSTMLNSNIFDLINAIIEKNIDLSLKYYDDLLILNEEEIKLIVSLANQFRLIYQVKTMFRNGYNEGDICKNLGGINPFRVRIANNTNVSLNECLENIKELSIIDEQIKTGIVDKKQAFLKYLLEMKK